MDLLFGRVPLPAANCEGQVWPMGEQPGRGGGSDMDGSSGDDETGASLTCVLKGEMT